MAQHDTTQLFINNLVFINDLELGGSKRQDFLPQKINKQNIVQKAQKLNE